MHFVVAACDPRAELLRLRESANSRNDPGDPNLEVLWATYKYVREPMGLPNSETFALFCDPNGTPRQYEHDELGRLKRVTYGTDPNRSPQEVFELDLAGNRKTYRGRNGDDANYVVDAYGANQYTDIEPGTAEPNYDKAGNLVQDHRGYTYTYDHDNKLIKVTRTGMPAVEFEYDALGRRIKKIDWSLYPAHDPVTYYASSGQNEVAEYNGAGQRVRYYVHGPTYIDERVVMHNDPVEGGAPTTGSDYIYLLKDLYTVAGLADERGWPVERYDYDAYGKVHMERVAILPWAADLDGDGEVDGDDLDTFEAAYKESGNEPNGPRNWRADLDGDGDVDGSDYVLFADAYNGAGTAPRGDMTLQSGSMVVSRVGNPFFFTGRRLDVMDKQDAGTPHHFTDDYAGLQLYDYRARTMDPVLGRFNQRDPIVKRDRLSWGHWGQGPRFNVQGFGTPRHRDGMNAFGYVRGMPVHRVDPAGLESMQTYIGCRCLTDCGLTGLIVAKYSNIEDTAQHLTDDAVGVGYYVNRAVRHCIASGLLAALVGCPCSECIGTKREDFQDRPPEQPKRESDRARKNNSVGRSCAGCGGSNSNVDPPGTTYPGWVDPDDDVWIPIFRERPSQTKIVSCCVAALKNGKLDVDPPRIAAPTE